MSTGSGVWAFQGRGRLCRLRLSTPPTAVVPFLALHGLHENGSTNSEVHRAKRAWLTTFRLLNDMKLRDTWRSTTCLFGIKQSNPRWGWLLPGPSLWTPQPPWQLGHWTRLLSRESVCLGQNSREHAARIWQGHSLGMGTVMDKRIMSFPDEGYPKKDVIVAWSKCRLLSFGHRTAGPRFGECP